MRLRRWAALAATPQVLATLVFAAIILLVAPYGDYPVNDDWQYARAARKLADSGHFVVDTPIAPSIVLQSYLAAGLIQIFGFSHQLLRLFTVLMALVLVWSVDRLLANAEVRVGVRRAAALVLVVNPWFVSLSLSYMSEIHGLVPAALGAVLWFRLRREDGPAISWWGAVLAGLLVGASYWTRQFSALLFPAMVGATVLRLAADRAWRRLLGALPALAAGTAVWAGCILAYSAWARATGNVSAAYAHELGNLTHVDPELWARAWGAFAAYATCFLVPLLLVTYALDTRSPWIGGLGLVVLAAAAFLLDKQTAPAFDVDTLWHTRFPYVGNLVFNAGIGPQTAYATRRWEPPHGVWPGAVWTLVELAIVVAGAAWGSTLRRVTGLGRGRRGELALFGLFWAFLQLGVAIQASGEALFDRYLFPALVGVLVAVAALGGDVLPSRRRIAAFAVALAPVAWFTVAGTHDYFRWNDARWHAVAELQLQGVSPTVIQGGYEVEGWLDWDAALRRERGQGCIGMCRCEDWVWAGCIDDSYQVVTGTRADYDVVSHVPVSGWLAEHPGIYVLRRRGRP